MLGLITEVKESKSYQEVNSYLKRETEDWRIVFIHTPNPQEVIFTLGKLGNSPKCEL